MNDTTSPPIQQNAMTMLQAIREARVCVFSTSQGRAVQFDRCPVVGKPSSIVAGIVALHLF